MKKIFLGITLSALLLGFTLVANTSTSDCCGEPQAECCYEGSPCCEE